MILYETLDGVCVLRLDAPPVHALTPAMLDALRAALDRAAGDPGVRGIVLTGGPEHFSAGADVDLFRRIDSADDAVRLSRAFQEAFQAVEDSPKPVVAAVAGRVFGGALELAMGCHGRVAARGSAFAMPEVKLGINPGAGGTQRLPRLIGVAAALRMLLGGGTLGADEALRLGLIDAVAEPGATAGLSSSAESTVGQADLATPGGELLAAARRLLASIAEPRRTSRLVERVADAAANLAALAEAERRLAAGRPELIAPRTILQAVRKGLDQSVAAGMIAERQGFAECMATPATRNRIDLFFATRAAGKLDEPAGATPRSIRRAAVVGLGSMGAGIVQALLAANLPVAAIDRDAESVERGMAQIEASLRRRVERGRLPAERAAEMLAALATSTNCEAASGCDLAIEAVWEDVALKRSVLARLEDVCSDAAILATNTSTIPIAALAEGMRRPERLLGMHFFNPAQRMPLVEVVRGAATSPEVVAAAVRTVRAMRKTPVVVGDGPGFLVNRIFIPYVKEALRLWEEGAAPEAIDAAMVEFGMPLGPLATIDMAGLDVLARTEPVMRRAFPRQGPLPAVADRLVAAGFHGQKSLAGVYSYAKGDYTPMFHPAAAEVVEGVRREAGRPARAVPAEEIVERLVLTMVCESLHVLRDGIARQESDIDVAGVLGMGFPDFRGGVMRYAREVGPAEVVGRLGALAATHGERFAPPAGWL
jgi:3-hydroxyacyl-CoA dehydrogenase